MWFSKKRLSPDQPAAPTLTPAEKSARRASTFATLEDFERATLPAFYAARAVTAEIVARVEALNAEIANARREMFTAAQAETAIRLQLDHARELAETQLLQLGEPIVDAFLSEIDAAIPETMRYLRTYTVFRQNEDITSSERVVSKGSNIAAIQVVVQAMHDARAQANQLKLQNIADMATAIDKLRQTIPSVDEAERAIEEEATKAAATAA